MHCAIIADRYAYVRTPTSRQRPSAIIRSAPPQAVAATVAATSGTVSGKGRHDADRSVPMAGSPRRRSPAAPRTGRSGRERRRNRIGNRHAAGMQRPDNRQLDGAGSLEDRERQDRQRGATLATSKVVKLGCCPTA